ncbi:MAG TPA: PhnD/SsuA/transferrin family substrate-binding protein, partial [Desulfosporosinus sp.]|nr:PhnD/SsuA/transferrin family substrate-binding protein [Desulfosporosinus sp.]
QRQSYQEINDLIKNGEVDMALICSGAYVAGQQDAKIELLAVPEVNGKGTYQSFLIVSADSNYQTLENLKGKTFAFTDPLSFSGRVAPR